MSTWTGIGFGADRVGSVCDAVRDFLSAHVGVSISHSQSSSIGYTLNVGAKKTARMIYTWHVYNTTLKTRNLVTRTGVCAETGGTYTETARKGFGYSLQFR